MEKAKIIEVAFPSAPTLIGLDSAVKERLKAGWEIMEGCGATQSPFQALFFITMVRREPLVEARLFAEAINSFTQRTPTWKIILTKDTGSIVVWTRDPVSAIKDGSCCYIAKKPSIPFTKGDGWLTELFPEKGDGNES